MNRRAAIQAALGPLVAALVVAAGLATPSAPVHAVAPAVLVSASAPAAVPEPTPPSPTTTQPFAPENEDSDCLGLLEQPGCGSKDRGGWRQTMVFVFMLAGLAAVFGRIGYGVYRNQR